MQFRVALRKAVGGVGNHHGIGSTDSQEKAHCLLEFFQAVNRRDQGTHGQTLGLVTIFLVMPDEAITEEELSDSLTKNGRVKGSGA